MFTLGLFPESLTYSRHTISPSFLARQGQLSYTIVAGMKTSTSGQLFRNLSEDFMRCVAALNWVKLYISDPFYQFMFREFQII